MSAEQQISPGDMEAWSAVALTAATVVLAVLALAGTVVIWRVQSLQESIKKTLFTLNEQSEKNSHLIFAISNLAIANLPKITFTQQIPSMVVESIGIIDQIFVGSSGDEFWRFISKFPSRATFARLAYLRAVYRLATRSDARDTLLEGSQSVVKLLDLASTTTSPSTLPMDLFGDILVRKCQALRQAGRPEDLDAAENVAKILIMTSWRSRYGEVQLWGPWCLALVHLQRASIEARKIERARRFQAAADVLQPLYEQAFGSKPKIAILRRNELGSFAYYTAKALWSMRMSSPAVFAEASRTSNDIGVQLRRSIIVSMGLLETARLRPQTDPCIDAIYHFCVALVIAVALELPETHDSCVADRPEVFEKFNTQEKLRTHAFQCLGEADEIAKEIATGPSAGGSNYIYCERTERLDTISRFVEDIHWVRNALETERTIPLSVFYEKETL